MSVKVEFYHLTCGNKQSRGVIGPSPQRVRPRVATTRHQEASERRTVTQTGTEACRG